MTANQPGARLGLWRHAKSRAVLLGCVGFVGLVAAGLYVTNMALAGNPDVQGIEVSLVSSCQSRGDDPAKIAERLVVKAWYPSGQKSLADGADTRSPVLFFNASWGGSSASHRGQFQALTARGFVVISVDHRLDLNEYDQFLDFSSEEAFKRTKDQVDAKARRFAADNSAVLDALQMAAKCASSSQTAQLARHLDFGRAGIFGYSFGGAVAAQTAWQDPRFKAAVNMDGWLFAEASTRGIKQAFLEMSDDEPGPPPGEVAKNGSLPDRLLNQLNIDDDSRIRANMQRLGGYYIVLKGSRHSSFMDLSALSIARRIYSLLRGELHQPEIINAYLGAFFDRYVAGGDAGPLERILSLYPDVRVEFAKPPVAGASLG